MKQVLQSIKDRFELASKVLVLFDRAKRPDDIKLDAQVRTVLVEQLKKRRKTFKEFNKRGVDIEKISEGDYGRTRRRLTWLYLCMLSISDLADQLPATVENSNDLKREVAELCDVLEVMICNISDEEFLEYQAKVEERFRRADERFMNIAFRLAREETSGDSHKRKIKKFDSKIDELESTQTDILTKLDMVQPEKSENQPTKVVYLIDLKNIHFWVNEYLEKQAKTPVGKKRKRTSYALPAVRGWPREDWFPKKIELKDNDAPSGIQYSQKFILDIKPKAKLFRWDQVQLALQKRFEINIGKPRKQVET